MRSRSAAILSAAMMSRRSRAIGWRSARRRANAGSTSRPTRATAPALDLALEPVDRLVAGDHLGGELGIAAHHGVGRRRDLALGHAAHLGDEAGEAPQLLVIALQDVL